MINLASPYLAQGLKYNLLMVSPTLYMLMSIAMCQEKFIGDFSQARLDKFHILYYNYVVAS